MKRLALIVYGGWNGHEPDLVSDIFKKALIDDNFEHWAKGMFSTVR